MGANNVVLVWRNHNVRRSDGAGTLHHSTEVAVSEKRAQDKRESAREEREIRCEVVLQTFEVEGGAAELEAAAADEVEAAGSTGVGADSSGAAYT